MTDETMGDNDKHLQPLFPSWSWMAWKGRLRLRPFPKLFCGSEMQILDFATFPPITVSSEFEVSLCNKGRSDREL
jgi:hypothetical protein